MPNPNESNGQGIFIEEIQPKGGEPEVIDSNTSNRNRPEDNVEKQNKDKEAKETERKLFLYRIFLIALVIIVAIGAISYIVKGIIGVYHGFESGVSNITQTVDSPSDSSQGGIMTTQLTGANDAPGPVKSNINVVVIEQVAPDQTESALSARIEQWRAAETDY